MTHYRSEIADVERRLVLSIFEFSYFVLSFRLCSQLRTSSSIIVITKNMSAFYESILKWSFLSDRTDFNGKHYIFLFVFLGASAMHNISREMLFQHWTQRTCVASVDVTKNLFSNLVVSIMRPNAFLGTSVGTVRAEFPLFTSSQKRDSRIGICVNEFRIQTKWLGML